MHDIVVVGDLHIRAKEPYFSSGKMFFEWFVKQPFNKKENVLVLLGDIFHESISNGDVNHLVIDIFLNQLKFHQIIVLQGNHDYSKQKGLGIKPLLAFENVEIITKPEERFILGVKTLLLPFYYNRSNDLPPMEEYYSDLPQSFNRSYDFIFTHITDETQPMFGKFINISYLNGKRVSGHIHFESKNYLGSPLVTRKDEMGKICSIGVINSQSLIMKKISVPRFIDFAYINFGDPLFRTGKNILLYIINNAPDNIQSVLKKYGSVWIHEINIVHEDGEEESIEFSTLEQYVPLQDHFKEYAKIKKVNSFVRDHIIELLSSQ